MGLLPGNTCKKLIINYKYENFILKNYNFNSRTHYFESSSIKGGTILFFSHLPVPLSHGLDLLDSFGISPVESEYDFWYFKVFPLFCDIVFCTLYFDGIIFFVESFEKSVLIFEDSSSNAWDNSSRDFFKLGFVTIDSKYENVRNLKYSLLHII